MPADLSHLALRSFRFDGSTKFFIKDVPTQIGDLYENDAHYETLLATLAREISERQELLYAHNRYGLLTIFQAMDAAGKDSTIQHVFTGANPLGLRVHSFKRPTEQELEHDFLWRSVISLPERGTIGIFNRSYYEEVLVVRVHPDILTQSQRLPEEVSRNLEKVWKHRYKDIRGLERYLYRNGFPVLKFYLHVSWQEQTERLIKRIEDPAKNWKFDEQDIVERGYWSQYMNAYEEAINETATEKAPWYVVPADNKKNMRLIVARIIVDELKKLKMDYPETTQQQRQRLLEQIDVIRAQKEKN